MPNKRIKDHAQKKGVRLWEVANAIGISEATFSRKMRLALPKDEAARIIAVIDEIAAKRTTA